MKTSRNHVCLFKVEQITVYFCFKQKNILQLNKSDKNVFSLFQVMKEQSTVVVHQQSVSLSDYSSIKCVKVVCFLVTSQNGNSFFFLTSREQLVVSPLPCWCVSFQSSFIVGVSENTIHLVCVMTGTCFSCVILSSTSGGGRPMCLHPAAVMEARLKRGS